MRAFTLLLLLLAACSETQTASIPADWVPVTASCGYTFMAPPDIVAEEIEGIDSCVDQWSTDSCALAGDLGIYSSPAIETPGLVDFSEWSEAVDGRMAQFSTARNQLVSAASQFQSSVYFSVVDSNRPDVRLNVSAYCSREAARDETLRLFRSIRFPEDLVN
jgi:hypothetical protein